MLMRTTVFSVVTYHCARTYDVYIELFNLKYYGDGFRAYFMAYYVDPYLIAR